MYDMDSKSVEEELWYNACGAIEEWEKHTGKSFWAEWEEVMRGN